jgi:hypothetical protein
MAVAGCAGSRPSSASSVTASAAAQDDVGGVTAQASDSLTICHIPGGDFSKAHNITVSGAAVSSHLAHGDLFLPCPEG